MIRLLAKLLRFDRLSTKEIMVLEWLSDGSGLYGNDLAKLADISRASIYSVLERLAARNYVREEEMITGRIKHYITPAGRAALRKQT